MANVSSSNTTTLYSTTQAVPITQGAAVPTGQVNESNFTTLYGQTGPALNPNGNQLINGNLLVTGTLQVDGCNITTDCTTFNLLPTTATTINFGLDATALNMGATTGTTTVNNDLAVDGNITVNADDTTATSSITFKNGGGLPDGVLDFSTANVFNLNAPLYISAGGANPATPKTPLFLLSSTAAPTVGFGTNLDFYGTQPGGGGSIVSQGQITTRLTDATVGATDVALDIKLMDNSASPATKLTLSSTGDLSVTGNMSPGAGDYLQLTGASSGYSQFTAPSSGANIAYVLPNAQGAASTVLTNDGSGNLSWALPGGGGSTFGNITIAVVDDNTISTTTGDLKLTTAAGGIITLTTDDTGPTRITRQTATTNAGVDVLAIRADTSGTAATNFGSSLIFENELPSGSFINGARISSRTTDVTPGGEDTNLFFSVYGLGGNLTQVATLGSSGNWFTNGGLFNNGIVSTLTATTASVYNGVATTLNMGGAATAVNIGASTGTTTVNNNLDVDGNLIINADQTAVSPSITMYGSTTPVTLTWDGINLNSSKNISVDNKTFIYTSGDIRVGNDIYMQSDIFMNDGQTGVPSLNAAIEVVRGTSPNVVFRWNEGTDRWQSTTDGSTYINLPNQALDTTSSPQFVNLTLSGDLAVNGGDITTTAATFDLLNANATTVNAFGAATGITIGAATGTTQVQNTLQPAALRLSGSIGGSSTFVAPASGSTLSYVLPGAAGAANTVLTNDGSGNLSWALPGGGGSTFGNVTVGVVTDNTISTTTGDLDITSATGVINLDTYTALTDNRLTTTSVSTVTLDSLTIATYQSASYTITIKDAVTSAVQTTKIDMLHDGTTAYINQYANMTSASDLATFSATVSGSNAVLQITPASTNSTQFTYTRIAIKV